MAVSGWISDPVSADYSSVASVAGDFANAFDTAWGNASALNTLQIAAITAICQQQFASRGPGGISSSPPFWTGAAESCVALLQAADTYISGQSISPPIPAATIIFGIKETFLTSGSFVVPAGITGGLFEGCGGGGGGGGGAGWTNADSPGGAGGGGAPRAEKVLTLTPGDIITITVGAGGTGGAGGAAANPGNNGTIGGDTIITSTLHGELGRFRGASGGMAATTATGTSYGGSSTTNSNGNGHTNYQVFEYVGTATNNGSIGNDATGGTYGSFGSPGAGGASGSGYAGFPGCDATTGTGGAGGAANSSSGGGGGGGGGFGAGGAGGASGISGSPGTAPVAGSAAAANTGAGGGGGGAGYLSVATGEAGAAGGNGGSGMCTVSW
jgi:hypothetical protein